MAEISKDIKYIVESKEEFEFLEESMKEFFSDYDINKEGIINVKKSINPDKDLEGIISIFPGNEISEIGLVFPLEQPPKGLLIRADSTCSFIQLGKKGYYISYNYSDSK